MADGKLQRRVLGRVQPDGDGDALSVMRGVVHRG
jgi:hypothetical protein